MKRRRLVWWGIPLLGLLAFVYLNNSSVLFSRRAGKPLLLAHRGLAQRFERAGLTATTCTATRIDPPEHPYLENTIASMRAAFAAGADVVEFDIHPTRDGHFAVIHDWTLECRTNGTGVTREHTLAELQALDIGYGYTADGGRTFPFRGKGVGLLPSLDEVLATFPERAFLINVKSNDPEEGVLLARRLGVLAPEHLDRLMAYGGDRPMRTLRERLPGFRVMSKDMLKSCLLRYLALGWTGIVPNACERMLVLVPVNVAPWLWGWPHRFLDRMERVGTRVFAVAPYDGLEFSSGLDDVQELAALPPGYSGGIWTDRIDRVGPLVKSGAPPPTGP